MSTARSLTIDQFDLDGFRLLSPLLENADEVVYLGESIRDPAVRARVWLSKNPWPMSDVFRLVESQRALGRFAAIQHPKVARILGHGFLHDKAFLIWDRVDGRALAETELDAKAHTDILIQLAGALAFAHQHDFSLRLNSSNVLLRGQGEALEVQVADWGWNPWLTLEEKGLDRRALDFLALGTLARQMSTQNYGPAAEIAKDYPLGLTRILRALESEEGYRSAEGLIEDLRICKDRLQRGLHGSFDLQTKDFQRNLLRPRLVDRASELEVLSRAFDKSRSGEVQILAVTGPSGLGKTSLVREAVKNWSEGSVLWASAARHARHSPYALIAKLVRGLLKPELQESVREAVGELGSELVTLVPELNAFLGKRMKPVELDPERRQVRFFSVATDVLRCASSSEQPLVLVWDDLHWVDEGSLEFLLHLARQSSVLPMLVLFTYRTDAEDSRLLKFMERLRAIREVPALHLEPLKAEGISALALSAVGKRLGRLEDAIFTQSQGVPAVAEDVLRSMVARQALRRSETGWTVVNPDALQPVVGSSPLESLLSDFDPGQLRILQLAAVMGREFSPQELVAADVRSSQRGEEEAAEFLVATLHLAEENWLVERAGGRFAFVHDQTREELLARLSSEDKALFHLAIANISEADLARRPGNIFIVADHLIHAGEDQHSLDCWIQAADAASRLSAHHGAIHFYQFALASKAADSIDEKFRQRLLISLADSFALTGQYDHAIETYGLCQVDMDNVKKAGVLSKIGSTRLAKGETAEATKAFEEALRMLGERIPRTRVGALARAIKEVIIQCLHTWFPKQRAVSSDPAKSEVLRLYAQLSYVYYFRDSLRTLAAHLRHLNCAERFNLLDEVARAYTNHGPAIAIIGWYSRALKYGRRSLTLRQQLGDRWGVARARTYLLVTSASSSALSLAIDYGKTAEEEFERLGDRWELVLVTSHLAHAYFSIGNWDMAEIYASKAERYSKEVNHPTGALRALWIRAEMGARLDTDKLLIELDEGLRDLRDKGDLYVLVMLLVGKGRTLLRMNRAEEAEIVFAEGISVMRTGKLRSDYLIGVFVGHVDALLHLHDHCAEEDIKPRWLARARKAVALAKRMTFGLPNHHAAVLRVDAAVLARQGRLRKAEARWHRALSRSVERHALYEQGLILRDWGLAVQGADSTRSENLLGQAAEVFAVLRAKADLIEVARFVPAKLRLGLDPFAMTTLPVPREGAVGASARVAVSTKRELDALLQVGLASVSADNSQEQIGLILNEVIKLLAADRAFLFVKNSTGGELESIAGRNSLRQELPVLVGFSRSVVNAVFEKRTPLILTGGEENEIQAQDSLALNDLRSVIATPLMLRESVIGVIYLDSSISSGLFTSDDLQILSVIASHIAIIVEASQMGQVDAQRREMAKDLEVTAVVQKLFLPPVTHFKNREWEIHGYNHTATQCSGDWWWYRVKPSGGLRLIVGDVTGHGAAPAMITASVASMLKALTAEDENLPLNEAMTTMSYALNEVVKSEYLMSGLVVEYEKGRLQLGFAASPPVFLMRKNGDVEAISRSGFMVGGTKFEMKYLDLSVQRGDRLLVYTDGVVEMELKRGTLLGDRGLLRLFQRQRHEESDQAFQNIINGLMQQRSDRPLRDDLTIVLVEFK